MGAGPTAIDLFGMPFAFGFAIVAMAYGIGPISGCHVNPAVSFGVFVAGRMSVADMVGYWIAQVLGAIVGALVLYLILSGKASGWTGGLGQNGWGPGYLGEYSRLSAFVFETVATFLFLVCILGVTDAGAPTSLAGLAIGLTLVVAPYSRHQCHRRFGRSGPFDRPGVDRHPLQSQGAVAQLWLFIVAPLLGAGAGGPLLQQRRLAGRPEEGLNAS